MTGVVQSSIDPRSGALMVGLDLGSGLVVDLDERSSAARPVDRLARVPLVTQDAPADVDRFVVRAELPDGPVEAEGEPQSAAGWEHRWSGHDSAGAAVGGSVRVPVRVGWRRTATFPRPSRTEWFDRSAVVGSWDARELGLGGLVPRGYVRLEVAAAVAWHGAGRRDVSPEIVPGGRAARHGLGVDGIGSDDLVVVTPESIHVVDPLGRLRRSVDRIKRRERFSATHDGHGRLVEWVVDGVHRYRVEHRVDDVVIHAPAQNWAQIALGPERRVRSIVTAAGGEIRWSIAPTGLVDTVTDVVGLEVAVTHDADGRAVSITRSTGERVDVVHVESASGWSTQVVSGGGREKRDSLRLLADGRQLRGRHCCGAEGETTTELDRGRRVTRRPDGTELEHREHETHVHAAASYVERSTLRTPGGRELVLLRDRRTGPGASVEEHLTVGTRTWVRRLDGATGTITETTPSGRMTTVEVLDHQVMRWNRPDAGTIETTYVDDLPVRVVRDGSTTEISYDEHGRVAAVIHDGHRREVRHDAAGRIIGQEQTEGWLTLARDVGGRIVAITTPRGDTTNITWTADGLPLTIERPTDEGTVFEEFRYDDDRLLAEHRVGDEPPARFQHDAGGQLVAVSAGDTTVEISFDPRSRQPIRLTTELGDELVRTYDGPLLVAEEATGRAPGRVEHEYASDHELTAVVVAGQRLGIERDRDGQIVVLGSVRLVRSPETGLVVSLLAGDLTTHHVDDPSGAPIGRSTTTSDGRVLLAEEITRDGAGRITAVRETRDGEPTRTTAYTYDHGGRLETVTVDGRAELRLRHDATANIVEVARTDGTIDIEVGAGDRLRRVGADPCRYDAAGRLVAGQGRDITYDGLGQLTAVTLADGRVVRHVRDAARRLIETSVDGEVSLRLLWEGNRVAAILRPDGQIVRCVSTNGTGAPDVLLGKRQVRLVTDHRGSVRLAVDAATGEVLQSIDYDPLGRIVHDSNPGFQPFGYLGAVHDPLTGLVEVGERVLDPTTSRFLQPDPLDIESGQVNPYVYAAGDPVNRYDPDGLQSRGGGGVQVCTRPFMGSRPFSIDHVYLKGENMGTRGQGVLRQVSDLVYETQWKTEDNPNHPQTECREVRNVDEECLDRFTTPGTPLGTWGFDYGWSWDTGRIPVHPNVCYDAVWDALDECAGPGGWEYGDSDAGEGPGIIESVARTARDGVYWVPSALKSIVDAWRDW